MRELANLLPALVGLFLGIVAVVSAHLATHRLKLHQQATRNAAISRNKG